MKKLNVAILEDNDDLRFDLHSEIEDKNIANVIESHSEAKLFIEKVKFSACPNDAIDKVKEKVNALIAGEILLLENLVLIPEILRPVEKSLNLK
jgi:3-phosphoglycerate kinase